MVEFYHSLSLEKAAPLTYQIILTDIQLNVKGVRCLEDAFEDYIQIETLTGENQYRADDLGLQDAHKGIVFESFPPVLHLQLKRFEYDCVKDQMIKVRPSILSLFF